MKKLISLIALGFLLSCVVNANPTITTSKLVFEKNKTCLSDKQVIHAQFYFGLPLKKIKRKLLRHLAADNLIESKSDFVKIELPEGKIIVNGKPLEGKLYTKYEGMVQTYEIGHGEKRGIQMSTNFIKVGDFYEDCFKGEASGKMRMSICGDDKKKKSIF